jgi:hypothetical protein
MQYTPGTCLGMASNVQLPNSLPSSLVWVIQNTKTTESWGRGAAEGVKKSLMEPSPSDIQMDEAIFVHMSVTRWTETHEQD